MSALSQARFAAALLDDGELVPDGLSAWNGPRPARRFAVYRNNVVLGLTGALLSRFPVTERVVGSEFFAGMARIFIDRHPPRSPLLLRYGDDFPEFAGTFVPAAGLPYLPDVMRLEIARGRAYHAADAEPLDPATLAGLGDKALADLGFALHTSVSILRSAHPVVRIWAMNAGEEPVEPIEDWIGEDALVVRPYLDVFVRRLPIGGAAFLEALAAGKRLGDAVEAVLGDEPGFDLAANLTGALQAGVFAAIR